MSITVAIGSHRFVCRVRLFCGQQGKRMPPTPHTLVLSWRPRRGQNRIAQGSSVRREALDFGLVWMSVLFTYTTVWFDGRGPRGRSMSRRRRPRKWAAPDFHSLNHLSRGRCSLGELLPSVVRLLKRHPLPANPDGLVFTPPRSDRPIARRWFNPRGPEAGSEADRYPSGPIGARPPTHGGGLASKAGMHPMAVKEMMGHSSIKVTFDVYGHLFPTMHEAGIASIESSFATSLHR